MEIIDIKNAVKLINNNDVVGISGHGTFGAPENLLIGLRKRYESENSPKNLTIACGIAPGDGSTNLVGLNNLAKEGLIKEIICAHLGKCKLVGDLAYQNKIALYTIPLGVYGHLLRAISGKQEGILTNIGLNTYCDPRFEGCKSNIKAKKEIVKLIKVNGKDQLFYKSFKINVAIIKATYADEDGNITLKKEPVFNEQIELAHATHNCGGIVICEVEKILPRGKIKPREVHILNKFIDYIVVAKQNKNLGDYNFPKYYPELLGEKSKKEIIIPKITLNERKVCARRALLELKKGEIINLGVGMPETIGPISYEEGNFKDFILSMDTGVFGGIPGKNLTFGTAVYPNALYNPTTMFDVYNGGILDVAILGFGEIDKDGNVNVSKFLNKDIGPGGFINITQSAKKIIFLGTFTSGQLEIEVKNGIMIKQEGKHKKFVKEVEQITFSGKQAIINNQEIMYITERAVFKLTKKGLQLIEIAPGISIKKDILPYMEFKPIIDKVKIMPKKIFANKTMNLK